MVTKTKIDVTRRWPNVAAVSCDNKLKIADMGWERIPSLLAISCLIGTLTLHHKITHVP